MLSLTVAVAEAKVNALDLSIESVVAEEYVPAGDDDDMNMFASEAAPQMVVNCFTPCFDF